MVPTQVWSADRRVAFCNAPSFSAPDNPLWGSKLGRSILSMLGPRDTLCPSLKAQTPCQCTTRFSLLPFSRLCSPLKEAWHHKCHLSIADRPPAPSPQCTRHTSTPRGPQTYLGKGILEEEAVGCQLVNVWGPYKLVPITAQGGAQVIHDD